MSFAQRRLPRHPPHRERARRLLGRVDGVAAGLALEPADLDGVEVLAHVVLEVVAADRARPIKKEA